MSSNKSGKFTFSISFLMIFVLVSFSLLGTASILFLSKKYSESALHTLADDIILRTVDDSAQHINILLKPAVTAVNIMNMHVPANSSISNSESYNNYLISSLIKTLEDLPEVYTLYYANEKGEFFLIGKRQKSVNDKYKHYFYKKIQLVDGERSVAETWYAKSKRLESKHLPNDTYDPRIRPWYKKAKNMGGAIWTAPYVFYITQLPGITYAEPIYESGKFVGVVAADLEINTISDFLIDGIFTKNTNIFAIDGQSNILAHTDYNKTLLEAKEHKATIPKIDNFNDPVLKTLRSKVEQNMKYGVIDDISTPEGRFKGVMKPFSVSGLELVVGVYTPSEDYLSPLKIKYSVLYIITAVLLILVILLSRYVSFTLARPFKALSSATNNAKELNFDEKINIITNLREVSDTQNNFNEMLESLKNYQVANEVLSETLHNAHIDTLYRLAMAAEHKDQYTYDHLKRVSDMSVLIADILGMSRHDIEQIRNASAMHDVGKLGIPDHILMKPGKLTVEEFTVIKTHSNLGAKILDRPSSEEMHSARVIAKSHHEKWYGSGYPDNLGAEDIPLYGRIVSVADVMDALLSKRPYKEPYSFDKTISIVSAEKGKHFDPELTDVVVENKERFKRLIEGS
ncbi:MAG: hypothetical protein C0603_04170 [Denitrovibrio sp.]|nr:MAG: hypothetical protein C0603_04170 [Denitrovibrio sp.]